ncbi:MAG: DUF4157 domain-containing protein [SAR202 cluster bacterium]|jgi:hypothetical protein|nr:DUF4157 domain-containing protein [SAR202 cluster bacterium]
MAKRVEVPESGYDRLSRWYDRTFLDNVTVLRGSLFGWIFGRSGQHAVTINKTVHLTSHARDLETVRGIALLGHEYFHVQQQRDMGWWVFLARYVWSWRPSHIKDGKKHPMEKPAYQRGREIRKALGE